MTDYTSQTPPERSRTSKILIAAIVLILLCVIGFHIFFPLLGIAIVMSAAAWGIVTATIVLFCIGILLVLIVPGLLVLLLCLFAFGWIILAIMLFPFLFPLIMPIFIILICVALLRKKR